jgi:hypothetical protein
MEADLKLHRKVIYRSMDLLSLLKLILSHVERKPRFNIRLLRKRKDFGGPTFLLLLLYHTILSTVKGGIYLLVTTVHLKHLPSCYY